MKVLTAFSRIFFLILSVIFMTGFMVTLPLESTILKVILGVASGILFSSILFSFESLFKKYNLKAFNTLILGLFFGFLLGLALNAIGTALLEITQLNTLLSPTFVHLLKACFFLKGTYLGTLLTIHFSDEIVFSIPFIKLTSAQLRKKDLILDGLALADPRIIDLASTGLIDNQLIISRFMVKELYSQSELGDEGVKAKAKRSIETLKRLESLPNLGLRFDETHFSDIGDPLSQLIRLARLTDSNILTADISQVQTPIIEGIKLINFHSLSNALKPLMQAGEMMKIKIQRYGKEPNQGVGYLEDGTMVVINGGGDYIGETTDVQVLSVKHTSSGRMIFCNMLDNVPMKGNRVEV